MDKALGDGLLMVFLVFLGGLLAVVSLVVWLVSMGRSGESDERGFEVKRPTGETPVLLEEKDGA